MLLTPNMLAAGYDMLRHSRPFNRWRLPPAAQVRFDVMKTRAFSADYTPSPCHHIRVSASRHDRLSAVMASIAHEMCHLRLEVAASKAPSGLGAGRTPKDRGDHGPAFRRLAASVCRHHPEFDSANF